ncbi:MAG: class I SAM-dependent methyltransferase [Acidimicrobiales bacterium]
MAIKRNGVIDDEVAHYAAAHSTPPDDVQQHLVEETEAATGAYSGMQIGGDQGVFMEILARAVGARSAIEIGTFTGYSSLAVAKGMGPDGRLLCCDVSEEWTAIARDHWERAGVSDRIDLRIAPALDTLEALDADVRFDLAFIDADKVSYLAYLEALVPHLDPGALVLVDNTLWSGRVFDDSVDDPDTVALRAFNEAVAADDRFTVVVLTIGDGVTMLQRR